MHGRKLRVTCLAPCARIGSLAVLLGFAYQGPLRERRTWAAFGALVLLAANRTWAVWSTSGLETRQFTLFVLLGMYLMHVGQAKPRRLIFASLAFVGAEFTRPEGSLLWALAGLWLLGEVVVARRCSWRGVLAFSVPFVILVCAHFVWRHAYYGDWLPNTYYAKYLRPWPEAGWRYFVAAGIETGAWLLVPLAVVGTIARIRCGDWTHVLPSIVIAGHIAYLTFIGGDHFELRPLDFYWPPLALASTEGILASSARFTRWVKSRWAPRVQLLVALALLAIVVVYVSAVQQAKVDSTLRLSSRDETHLLIVKLSHENSPSLFALPLMGLLIGVYNELEGYTLRHGVGTVWREHEVFWRDEMRKWARYGEVRGAQPLPIESVAARASIGVFGYYLADMVLLDQEGLTDRHVAHQPTKRSNEERYMAHDRIAEPEYLYSRGFNIVVGPTETTRGRSLLVAPFALGLTDELWMPITLLRAQQAHAVFKGRALWMLQLVREVDCFRGGVGAGWTFTGGAFAGGPSARTLPLVSSFWQSRCAVEFGMSSRTGGAGRTGRARSPVFAVASGTMLELRLGGTPSNSIGARLIDASGTSVADVHAIDESSLFPVHFDLTPYAGRELALELYDESDQGWLDAAGIVILEARPLTGG